MTPKHPNPNEHKFVIAWGIAWALAFLGFGGCCMMTSHDGARPIIQIETSKSP